jgi:ribonuclease-3
LIGAVYLDGGFAAAQSVCERLFGGAIDHSERGLQLDYKSRLQERSQAVLQMTPQYAVIAQEGPDHDKTFRVAITLGGQEYGRGVGKSKKEAEQSAAALALAKLDEMPPRSARATTTD